MSSPDRRRMLGMGLRLTAAVLAAGLTAACFQPLYGQRTLGGPPVRDALSAVSVQPIGAPPGTPEARIAVELRNRLLFDLNGGMPAAPTHELAIHFTTERTSVIIDPTSLRPDVDNFGMHVTYVLRELATGKVVVNETTFARVSYDTPGSEQRFARLRGLRDAENRAARSVAEQIRNRLASYFIAGT
jgi:LPS-assembly lipoprotein